MWFNFPKNGCPAKTLLTHTYGKKHTCFLYQNIHFDLVFLRDITTYSSYDIK